MNKYFATLFICVLLVAGCKSGGGGSEVSSQIDPSKPETGSATTSSVRDNFGAAKSEIEELQTSVGNHVDQSDIHQPLPARVTTEELQAGVSANTRLWSPVDVAAAVTTFRSGVDPTPSTSPLWLDGSVSASEITNGGVAVVVAHFDDEILWAMPALQIAKDVSVIMIPFSSRQQTVLEAMPDWYAARFRRRNGITDDSTYLSVWANSTARESLLQREAVRARVWDAVQSTPAHNIVTHNPWGEYGHMHHRLVYEEVRAACVEFGKSCWFSSVLIPADGGSIGGADPADYLAIDNIINITVDTVVGRMSKPDLEALRQVFLDTDTALDGVDGLPRTWTWDDTYHPAWDDGGFGYVDYTYLRVVDEGVADSSQDPAFAIYENLLPLFGCPSGVCAYYP